MNSEQQTRTCRYLRRPGQTESIKGLQVIPGVGPSIAEDLNRLGIKKVSCLKGRDPEKLYARYCDMEGHPVDRCLLYVFRCAVYYASNDQHDPELLKWWNWADKNKQRNWKAHTNRKTI